MKRKLEAKKSGVREEYYGQNDGFLKKMVTEEGGLGKLNTLRAYRGLER